MDVPEYVDLSIPKYNERLTDAIQEMFSKHIVVDNVLSYFHEFDINVLSKRDIEAVYAEDKNKGHELAALMLLNRLRNSRNWFSCLLKVLRHPPVKLGWLADKFEEKKKKLDELLRSQNQMSRSSGNAVCSDACSEAGANSKSGSADISDDDRKCILLDGNRFICRLCDVDLTSDEMSAAHFLGKKHCKKAKEAKLAESLNPSGPVSQENNQPAREIEPFNWETITVPVEDVPRNEKTRVVEVGEDEKLVKDKRTGKFMVIRIQNRSGTLPTERNDAINLSLGACSIADFDEFIILDSNGKGKCSICKCDLTSFEHARSHSNGKNHKKMKERTTESKK